MVDTTYRSAAPEIMDDFAMEGEILRDALDKIASINKLLGGNKVTLQGVKRLLKGVDRTRSISILDVGCGNGDMLRTLADYATKKDLNFVLYGIDANAFTIKHAQSLSASYPNISYYCDDIFNENLPLQEFDIILCTLTLHHFKNDEILKLLSFFHTQARLGLVINDLHRSKLAYYLFTALCYVFGLNDMSREDGLVSILRGFKRSDLEQYSKQLQFRKFSIRWKWAFRYQWIISSICA
jgi:2-polyprenyl-3-methyl-5-hydroxy-6-metoxy-1,4-benzoquinol methylase